MHKIIFTLLAIFIPSITFPFGNHSFMTYRSQGINLARNVTGWQSLRTDIFNGDALGNVALTVEYNRSFNPSAINRYFFGRDCITFSGSRRNDRGNCDIMADYFGLPTDFKSRLSFDPRIRNTVADIDFYWNLDSLIEGFNLHFNVPVTSSHWALNPCETIIDPGTAAYPAGYMSSQRTEAADLKKGALDMLSGCQTFGDVTYPLQFGRIDRCEQHTTKIADILVALGYTFVRHEPWLIGANLQVIVPTGTYSTARTVFEPQVGNGHHWALGVGLTARYDIIDYDDRDLTISACLDASIQHLFKNTQMRSYDLNVNGPGSRYMLLEDMVGAFTIAQNFSPVPFVNLLDQQYITRLLYVIDATTLPSTIKINAQADIVLKITADYRDWNFDLGYNFWGRTAETLVCRGKMNHKYYGIKGDASLYGFIVFSPSGPFLSIPDNATQSHATLHAGQGKGNTTHNFINANADNAAPFFNVGIGGLLQTIPPIDNTGVTSFAQVNGSNQAVTLVDGNIDNHSGLSPRAFSNKIFGSAGYTWNDCNHVIPFVALGAEGEFAGSDDCINTAISQWGIWIKGGFNY